MIASPPGLLPRLDLARAVAARAGEILTRHRGRLAAVAKKGDIDLVTEADRASEAAIVAAIAERFPSDRVIAEEGSAVAGDGHDGYTWLVDPLDGTTNFVHGLPWFAVSVGALWRGVPVLGVIGAPALGRAWHGALGHGAHDETGARLRVCDAATLKDGLLATGFPYDRDATAAALVGPVSRALAAGRDVRRMGAAALDLAAVADGTFAGYWEPRLKPWDLAAGILLVREAGGRVTDFAGADAMLSSGDVIAAPPQLHAALTRVVRGDDALG